MKQKIIAIFGILLLVPYAEAGFKWLPDVDAVPEVEEVIPAPIMKEEPLKTPPKLKPEVKKEEVVQIQPALSDSLLSARIDKGGIVYGFGDQVPLVIALRQIVPTELQFSYGAGVDLSALVTWRGGKSWPTLLDEVLKPLELSAYKKGDIIHVSSIYEYETDLVPEPLVSSAVAESEVVPSVEVVEPQLVSVEEQDDFSIPTQITFEEEMVSILDSEHSEDDVTLDPPSEELPVLETVSVTDVAKAEVEDVWVVERGRTLQEILQEWSDKAGWVVVWNTDRDYLIESAAVFEGRFDIASADLIRAFAIAEPPVMATFYKNRTIVVESQNDGEAN